MRAKRRPSSITRAEGANRVNTTTDSGAGDLYEMMTYLLVIIISALIMVYWLRRKGRNKRGKKD